MLGWFYQLQRRLPALIKTSLVQPFLYQPKKNPDSSCFISTICPPQTLFLSLSIFQAVATLTSATRCKKSSDSTQSLICFKKCQAFNTTYTLKKHLSYIPEKEASIKQNDLYCCLLNTTARIYEKIGFLKRNLAVILAI